MATLALASMVCFVFGFSLSYKNDLIGSSINFLLKCYSYILSYSSLVFSDVYDEFYEFVIEWGPNLETGENILLAVLGIGLSFFSLGLILSTLIHSLRRTTK